MEGRNKVANPHAGRMRLPLCGHGKGKSCTVLTRVSGDQLSLQNTTEVTSLRQWASSYLLFCSQWPCGIGTGLKAGHAMSRHMYRRGLRQCGTQPTRRRA